jgi:hypothetical protein
MMPRKGRMPACTFCANHCHRLCRNGECACGARGHRPDVETAAAMRRYERPDMAALPVERLASDWHRKEEGR